MLRARLTEPWIREAAFGSSPPKRDRMVAMKSADRAPFWDAQVGQGGFAPVPDRRGLDETEVLLLPFRDLIKAYQKSKYLREHLEGPLKPENLAVRLR